MDSNLKENILIVDDTPANLELLSDMLKQGGYRVRAALNGNLALQAARNEPPDLILLDITMPDMDGYEVCRLLKEDEKLHDIPVIFISALNEMLDKIKAFSSGGVDYITKPFQFEEVAARVGTHLKLIHVERLKHEIAERKQAEEKIRQSLCEKETLIRELYHRTKNTLQVINSIIQLQANEYTGNEELQKMVKKTEYKIRTISLVHQMLFKSQDLSQIPIREYIYNLTEMILDKFEVSADKLSLSINVQDQFFLLDTAIPFGLILNELMTNSLQHAFPDNYRGIIRIILTKCDTGNILQYIDNGIGVPEGFDFRNQNTLGLKLIHNIGELQMGGRVDMMNTNGVICTFEFPDNLYKARV